MADGQIELQLTLETGEVVKAFAKVETQAEDSGKKVEKSMSAGMKAAGLAVGAAFATAFVIGIKSISSAISEGINAEASLNKFNASLRAAGMFSQSTSQSFQQFASAMQETTKFTDDEILSLSSLALNYAKNEEQAKKLTAAAIELAAATGQSADSALQQLGGTLNGSVGKLSKLGGGFSQLTDAQLKSGAAIDLVAERFRGLASSEITTFSGILGQITKAWNDWSEVTGLAIIQSPKLKAFLNGIVGALRSVVKAFDPTSIQKFTSDFISGLSNIVVFVAKNVLPILEILGNVFIGLIKIAAFVASKIFDFLSGIAMKVASVVGPFLSDLKKDLEASFKLTAEGLGGIIPEEIKNGLSALGDTPVSDTMLKFVEKIDLAVDEAAPLVRESGKKSGKDFGGGFASGVAESLTEFQKNFESAFVGVSVGAFQALGASMVKGSSAFKDFGKTVLNLLGDLAIKTGVIVSGMGKALTVLAAALTNPFTGPAAVVAGIALIALGGALKALAGGGGGASVPSAGGGVASSGSSPVSEIAQETTASIAEPGTQLVVNVQGSVFDSDETGLRIADIIKTNFDRKDVRFA